MCHRREEEEGRTKRDGNKYKQNKHETTKEGAKRDPYPSATRSSCFFFQYLPSFLFCDLTGAEGTRENRSQMHEFSARPSSSLHVLFRLLSILDHHISFDFTSSLRFLFSFFSFLPSVATVPSSNGVSAISFLLSSFPNSTRWRRNECCFVFAWLRVAEGGLNSGWIGLSWG